MKIITSIKYSIDEENQSKNFHSKKVRIENSQGMPIKFKWLNAKDELTMEMDEFYDNNGELIKYTQYHPENNYIKIWEIERDNQNRINKINFRTSRNLSDYNYGEINYKYSPNSKSVKIIEHELGEMPKRSEKHYDDNGNTIKEIEFNEDMEIVNELRYRFYENGKIRELDYFGFGGKTLQSRTYFNQNGEEIKVEYFGKQQVIIEFEYKYNLENLWIERRTFKNSNIQFFEIREIKKEHDCQQSV